MEGQGKGKYLDSSQSPGLRAIVECKGKGSYLDISQSPGLTM